MNKRKKKKKSREISSLLLQLGTLKQGKRALQSLNAIGHLALFPYISFKIDMSAN